MKSFKDLFRPKVFITSALLIAASVFGVTTLAPTSVSAAKCDVNDIVDCGVPTKQHVADAMKSTEIQRIYGHSDFGGLSPNEISRFLSKAQPGTAYKDGRLILNDGRIVGTKGKSMGRTKLGGANPHTVNIGGKDYFWGYNNTAFGSNSLPVWILMDENNKYMEFAVIKDCGNPLTAERPAFECKELKQEKVNDNTYKFWTEVKLKNATIKNLRYEFSDGGVVNEKDPNKKISHTFTKPGTHTVKVTVTYIVNGKEQSETLQTKCQTKIEVKEKKVVVAKCDKLDAFLIEGTRKYKFVGIASVENATVKTASFDYGDGSTAPGTIGTPSNNKVQITGEHQYANELVGKKTITLTLTFDTTDGSKPGTCKAEVEFKEKTCKDEPNRPECQPPCVPKEGEDTACKILPKEIVKTGPAEIIGSALGLSTLAGAGMYYRASRKNLFDLFKQ